MECARKIARLPIINRTGEYGRDRGVTSIKRDLSEKQMVVTNINILLSFGLYSRKKFSVYWSRPGDSRNMNRAIIRG